MKTQNFSNHIRRHPLYHYFILPLSLILIIAGILNILNDFNFQALLILIVSICIHLLAFLARDYAKKNQDRIIRMEMRLRYWQLRSKDFEELEKTLSLQQVLALRFASDEELMKMLDSTTLHLQSALEIKQHIKNWKPDTLRV